VDAETRATLETAALLMREGYVVKNAYNLFEDACGNGVVSSGRAACGCFVGCLLIAAWDDFDLAATAETVLDAYVPATSPNYADDYTALLATRGPEACIAVIEKALAAGAES
jgi:hypothetical protein